LSTAVATLITRACIAMLTATQEAVTRHQLECCLGK
jgi:hypothetical protein